ncbi:MAG: hypothetical protein ABI843_16040 [Dokdonella sp.]
MSRDKIIAVVGVSDEETAHLRLLMRKCVNDLESRWRWGSEDHADLLVVEIGSFAGQMARMRAQTAGMRCAVFATEAVEGADLVLKRPLLSANVVTVLNQAASVATHASQIAPHTTDFYTRDIGDVATSADGAPESDLRVVAPAGTPAIGLDEMLRREPIELRSAAPRGPRVLEPKPADSEPGATPVRSGEALAPSRSQAASAATKTYATRAAMLADTEPRRLRQYLEEDLLLRPAWIALPDTPPLAFDPKLRVVHSAVGLGALEPYCHVSWRLCDWQPLTTAELAELRQNQPAQPYSRLIWLDVLVASQGHLATHLDPGGTYRLTRWIEIEKELSRYFRIASAMLQPARLHEIAATAGAPMADVFDIVNAYDAIGLIEWQPRPRRDDGPARGLMQKLRRSFGKS